MLIKQTIIFACTIAGIILAYPFGLESIAYTLALVGILDFLITSRAIYLTTKLRFISFIKYYMKNFYIAFIFIAVFSTIDFIVDWKSFYPIISLLLAGVFSLLLWVLCIILLNHPILLELKKIKAVLIKKWVMSCVLVKTNRTLLLENGKCFRQS